MAYEALVTVEGRLKVRAISPHILTLVTWQQHKHKQHCKQQQISLHIYAKYNNKREID